MSDLTIAQIVEEHINCGIDWNQTAQVVYELFPSLSAIDEARDLWLEKGGE